MPEWETILKQNSKKLKASLFSNSRITFCGASKLSTFQTSPNLRWSKLYIDCCYGQFSLTRWFQKRFLASGNTCIPFRTNGLGEYPFATAAHTHSDTMNSHYAKLTKWILKPLFGNTTNIHLTDQLCHPKSYVFLVWDISQAPQAIFSGLWMCISWRQWSDHVSLASVRILIPCCWSWAGWPGRRSIQAYFLNDFDLN